jgi:hypothetical protein
MIKNKKRIATLFTILVLSIVTIAVFGYTSLNAECGMGGQEQCGVTIHVRCEWSGWLPDCHISIERLYRSNDLIDVTA